MYQWKKWSAKEASLVFVKVKVCGNISTLWSYTIASIVTKFLDTKLDIQERVPLLGGSLLAMRAKGSF